jgi:GNAT superfamily N-acetyltransferase
MVQLNREAYVDLIEDDVVFDEAQIRSHLDHFPEGQIVAELDGEIVGAIATMIVPRAIDPLAPHTWMGITDGGLFLRHDPLGDTLYLADIYVAESVWGKGVGRALYQALFDLCRKLGLARVIGGGRLYDYDDHAAAMAPDEYVARVLRGELKDRVLVSQLRAGFEVRGLLPSYLHDWRSRHWATLLYWANPERTADVEQRVPRAEATPKIAPPT